ncbi:MAG TPA: hypothetical protein VJ797_02570 [Burkholderiales bacterium]|nr:hypothetical protein [Burkholderiales bacterium]
MAWLLTAATASAAGGASRPGARPLFASLVVAPPLAGLLWMSGAVTFPAALGSMALFVFVVMSAGFLLLRAAHATDMPAPAAWVLGVFATAIAIYALITAFHLLAASAFAIWAAIVAGVGVFVPERSAARRIAPDGLLGLLLCAAATLYWCWDLVQVPQVLARDGVLATWTDQFIHGAVISQFGDPRAAGRQAIELADLPIPLYHYASYMLPAAFAWPLDLPGLPLATSVWVPVGFFTLCAGIYVLGAALAGAAGGVAALAALTLLPDPANYGLYNALFGYYWYVLAVPGASYAVGVSLLAIAFLHRWRKRRGMPALAASAGLICGTLLIRLHVFLLALPAWLVSTAMLTPFIRRRKLAFFAAASAAFTLFVLAFYRWSHLRPALEDFLDVTHNQQVPLAYAGFYGGLMQVYGPGVAIPAGVLLVFPACLGAFVIFYPLSVLLVRRSRGLEAIDFVPVALLACYLLMIISAPVPPNGDPTELTQRPFVLVYAVIAIWTVAGFVNWLALAEGRRLRRRWWVLLALAAITVPLIARYTDRDWRWDEDHQLAQGLPQAAHYLRSHWRPGDVLAAQGLKAGRIVTDTAIQLVSLTGMPAYVTRPFIHASRGGRTKEVALERHAALADVAREQRVAAALARLRERGIQWYVVADGTGPRWDPERRHAAFVGGDVAVYSSRTTSQ